MWEEEVIRGDLTDRFLRLAAFVIKLTSRLPHSEEGNLIREHLLHHGTSIGTDYEQALGAESSHDFIYKMGSVLQGLKETRFWLRLIILVQFLPDQDTKPVVEETQQLIKIVTKGIGAAKKRRE